MSKGNERGPFTLGQPRRSHNHHRTNSHGGSAARPLSSDEFVASKTALAKRRDGHLYDAALRVARGMGHGQQVAAKMKAWAADKHSRADPPSELVVWDASLGTTRTATAPGPGAPHGPFRGTLTFHSGDMISGADVASKLAPPGKTVAVLNMANASHVGGGFLTGARAQEEQLCHRSDLFLRLRVAQADKLYPIRPGSALVTPAVALLRAGPEQDFAPLADANNELGVISVAARQYANEQAALADPNLRASLVAAWRAVVDGARELGSSVVVVSALGAGAFHNPPDVVGEALVQVLGSCHAGTELAHVAVIVLDDHNSQGNVKRMREGMRTAVERAGLQPHLAAFEGFGDAGPLPVPTLALTAPAPAPAPASAAATRPVPRSLPPLPVAPPAPPTGSQEARRLLAAQEATLGSVARQLLVPAKNYHKTGHWAWYVFPTTKVGKSDTTWRTAVKGPDDVAFLMHQGAIVAVWSSILERLALALTTQRSRDALPRIDHGRVGFFLVEWSTPAYRAAMAGTPQFVAGFEAFKDAWGRT